MSNKAKKVPSKFPRILYVVVEEEGTENEFLYPVLSLADIAVVGQKRQVAVYRKEVIENVTAVLQVVE